MLTFRWGDFVVLEPPASVVPGPERIGIRVSVKGCCSRVTGRDGEARHEAAVQ